MKTKLFLFLIPLIVFLILLHNTSPYVTSGDSGEFITTSCILGIAHSPGYPLYSLLGKVFSYINPFGNYAYRINLMNIFFTVFILIICSLMINNISKDYLKTIINIFVFLTFIFSESYFRNTVQTEVFVLNIFFATLLIFFSYKEIRLSSYKNWYMISFIFGLSLGNHHTIVFLIPSLIYLFFINRIKIKKLPIFLLFFFLGFSIYLFIPIRANKEPYFNWGNAKNLRNLYRVITRKDYGTFTLTVEKPLQHNFKNVMFQLKRFLYKTLNDLTLPLVFLIIWGFIKLYLSDKKLFFGLVLSYLFSGPFFFILSNLPKAEIYEGILERFYILPNFVGIVTIIFSIFYVKERLILKVLLILSIFCLYLNFSRNYSICNYRKYYLNYDYGMNILRTLLKDSFLIMEGGDDTFYTLGYMQAVENRRQDVKLHDRGGLVFKSIYGNDFRSLTKEEKEKRRVIIEKQLVKKSPLFYSTFNKNILPEENLKYAGVLYVVSSEFVPKWFGQNFFFNIYSYRSLYEEKYYDYRSKALLPIYWFMEAVNERDIDKKIKILKLSISLWKEVDWLKNNTIIELHNEAYKLLNQNVLNLSKNIYEIILNINPEDINAYLNLGVIFERLNHTQKAVYYYNKAIEIDPYNPNAYYNLGVLYWKQLDWDKVIEYFNKVLTLQPNNYQVRMYLNRAIEEKRKTH